MPLTALPSYPSLYQINTRVWLTALGRALGRTATLDDIPDSALDELATRGFDWIWLLSVWQTGERARDVSRSQPEWRREFAETLPDLRDEDIGGSGFAITGYTVHTALGGDAALARLRQRLERRGLRLMLDFVPNHMGLGHPWVEDHPERFVAGTELDLAQAPQNYLWVERSGPKLLLAHGRDPYFPGWPDTLQLNYANPSTQEAMLGELTRIAGQCDGLRCDMAMLVLPEVFERTWGLQSEPFWPRAIEAVRARVPEFCFMAEVYWDLEWTLQQQGFNYAYDKRLYDRLRAGPARAVRAHLGADLDYQRRLARFLENHDEPRAAATFGVGMHEAAAAVTYLSPGLRFFHQGQFEGYQVRISPHLCRGPSEPVDPRIQEFYSRLLSILRDRTFRQGSWQLLEATLAWEGNGSHDDFVIFAWKGPADERRVVTVNYATHPSQAHVRLPFSGLDGRAWHFHDLLSDATYEWQGQDLTDRGLYLNEAPWQVRVFELLPASPEG